MRNYLAAGHRPAARAGRCPAAERGGSDRAGLTLIDTVITIGIVAILAAVAIPAVSSAGVDVLEATARVLAADLRLARSQAVAHNTTWEVRFDLAANAYELVHTGTGPASPLIDPLAGAADRGAYRVRLDDLTAAGGGTRVRLAGAALGVSETSVTSVTFGPSGGTGPGRTEDTVIVLTSGTGSSLRMVRLTVSWVTGSVWIGPLAVGPS